MCANAMLLVMKNWTTLRIGEIEKKKKLNRPRQNTENPVTITENKVKDKLLSDTAMKKV